MPERSLINKFLTFIFVAIFLNSMGQSTVQSKRGFGDNWQINYNLGFTEFYGDASNNGYFNKFSGEISFATGLTVRKYITPAFGLGVNFLYSGLKSHKEKSATGAPVNFTLEGKYFDGNINLLLDFNSLFWGPGNRKLSVYGIVGLGYASWNSKLTDTLSGIIKNSGDATGTDTYKKGGVVVPVGMGLNYMLSNNWAINLEMNLRTVLNDDVDVWRSGFKYDQPFYTSVGVSYFINRNVRSRKVKKAASYRQKTDTKTVKEEPLAPVPLFDYSVQPENNKSSAAEPEIVLIEAPVKKGQSGVIYRVQILAKRDKLPSLNYLRKKYNLVGDIYENFQDGVYRYSMGSFDTYGEALSYSYLMKDKGVQDAFVVAYRNDLRISISSDMKNK